MRTLSGLVLSLLLGFSLARPAPAAAAVKIVAAENVYGGIAERIGGRDAEVISILNNPERDPHLFEASPSVVRRIAEAQIVIVNGAGYDTWADKLLEASPRPARTTIDVARLTGWKPGGNPHLWYAPATMPKVAAMLAAALSKADPDHATGYDARLKTTLAGLVRVQKRVAALRAKWAGHAVTATEPVFGPTAVAIGLTMRNRRFQIAMMNDTEPSARDVAAFEGDLKQHRVEALIVNKQVSDPLTARLIAIARKAEVPVVAVTETQPVNATYEHWMLSQLDALDRALAGGKP